MKAELAQLLEVMAAWRAVAPPLRQQVDQTLRAKLAEVLLALDAEGDILPLVGAFKAARALLGQVAASDMETAIQARMDNAAHALGRAATTLRLVDAIIDRARDLLDQGNTDETRRLLGEAIDATEEWRREC